MRRKLLILAMCLAGTACTQKSEMDIFIDDLMGQMTVEEKIGQFNLPHDGDIITGPDRNPLAVESIQNGEVGGLFGLKGLDRLRELQRIAVPRFCQPVRSGDLSEQHRESSVKVFPLTLQPDGRLYQDGYMFRLSNHAGLARSHKVSDVCCKSRV